MKSVLLIGIGRFGRHIAMKLNDLGHQVMAIDNNEEPSPIPMPCFRHAQAGKAQRC